MRPIYIVNIENSSIIILWASVSTLYDHAYKSSYKFVSILINKYVNLHINLIIERNIFYTYVIISILPFILFLYRPYIFAMAPILLREISNLSGVLFDFVRTNIPRKYST